MSNYGFKYYRNAEYIPRAAAAGTRACLLLLHETVQLLARQGRRVRKTLSSGWLGVETNYPPGTHV
jgi:hypothetical protein